MFGERLKSLREDRDLFQKDVAKAVGVSDRTIGMYENERRQPDFETLKKLADYFGVTADYILGRADHKQGYVQSTYIKGSEYEFELDKTVFPNGLTYKQMEQRLKALEEAGFKFNKR